MSKMKDVMVDLQDAINRGNLSFQEIAAVYNVPLNWVYLALTEVLEQYRDEDAQLEALYEERFECED